MIVDRETFRCTIQCAVFNVGSLEFYGEVCRKGFCPEGRLRIPVNPLSGREGLDYEMMPFHFGGLVSWDIPAVLFPNHYKS